MTDIYEVQQSIGDRYLGEAGIHGLGIAEDKIVLYVEEPEEKEFKGVLAEIFQEYGNIGITVVKEDDQVDFAFKPMKIKLF